MKYKLIFAAFVAASSLSAQSFVAGWDFDDVNAAAPSATANWGDLAGSATLSWSHSPQGGPPSFTAAEFGISTGFNSAVVGNTFAFVDPNTGYDKFSDGPGVVAGEYGFESVSSGDSFTFTFDGSGYTGLSLSYAVDAAGDGNWATASADLSSFSGSFQFNTAAGARYDNFAVTGAVVPEPSSYAAIFGVIAIAFVASRRRR
jgi:hypothetical protein